MFIFPELNPVLIDKDRNFELRTPNQHGCYFQKWEVGDVITMQIMSDEIVNVSIHEFESLMPVRSLDFIKIESTIVDRDFYEASLSLLDINEGKYLLVFTGLSSGLRVKSKPFLLKKSHTRTIPIYYRNSKNDFGVAFDTGIEFFIRADASVHSMNPVIDSTIFFNQIKKASLLKAVPWETYTLQAGGSFGIPESLLLKLNYVMSCDRKRLESMSFELNEGAEWEVQRVDGYPLVSATVEIVNNSSENSAIFDFKYVLSDNENNNITTSGDLNIVK